MKRARSIAQLAKFLDYVLGRYPDEFALFPDQHGYVKIKDLMKVLAEESGWRHVRLNQVREVMHTARPSTIEMDNNRIRAVNRTHLFVPKIPDVIPKLLHYPIRRRAYPVILENGLPPEFCKQRLVLTETPQLALRIGRRIDPSPIILTVNTNQAGKAGAAIWRFGQVLYLLDCLPVGCFSGPPLPKNRPDPKVSAKPEPPKMAKTPGSYLMDLTAGSPGEDRPVKRRSGRKNEWKRERKRKSRANTFRGSDR